MYLSKHFTLEELTFSQTATRLQLDNTPSSSVLTNLKGLANFLEVIRQKINSPVIVTSGYRNPELNRLIGSTAGNKSHHVSGRAADIVAPSWGTPKELAELIVAMDLEFDEIILEFHQWVHVAISENPRHKIFTATHGIKGTEYHVGIV